MIAINTENRQQEKNGRQYDERPFHSTGKYAAQKRKKRKETERLP